MAKFIPQYQPVLKLKYIYAVVKQMLSGWVGTGTKVEEFEEAIKDIAKADHVISTTSGTMALYLAISALKIPKNKKIIFPAYTFLAGANVAKHLGYKLEFLDVSRQTMCIDPWVLEKRLKQKSDDIGVVIFVDHNGLSLDAPEIKNICKEYNIPMIEDSAQAIGSGGWWGDIAIFSFSVPKLVTTGQGGVVFTNNSEYAERMRQIRDHGDNWRKTKIHNHIGINLKFNDILAAYGLAQLKDLEYLIIKRQRMLLEYKKYLPIKGEWYHGRFTSWMVIYHTDKADKIIEELGKHQIQAVKYYRSIPSNPSFNVKTKFENAEYIHQHFLYLPSSLNLTKKDIKRICKIIKEVENERI